MVTEQKTEVPVLPSIPKVETKAPKKNLFNDDDSDEDFFASKNKKVVKQSMFFDTPKVEDSRMSHQVQATVVEPPKTNVNAKV